MRFLTRQEQPMQWYESQTGMQRLQAEQALVHDLYPRGKFQLELLDNGCAAWIGHLGPNEHIRNRYAVCIVYPKRYMTGTVPRVDVLAPEIDSGAPHLWSDGSLCVEHGDFNANDPITEVFGWTVQWLTLYEHWQLTGERW